jgi:hypothetical protein
VGNKIELKVSIVHVEKYPGFPLGFFSVPLPLHPFSFPFSTSAVPIPSWWSFVVSGISSGFSCRDKHFALLFRESVAD